MKTIKFLFATVIMLLSLSASAQTSKVVAIVNKADWCSICKAYAGRTVEAFTANNSDSYFQFIVNDITNEDTKKTSQPAVKKVGLEKTVENSLASGVLSFYDAKSKKLLAQVTVANSPEEIATVMKMVREKAGM